MSLPAPSERPGPNPRYRDVIKELKDTLGPERVSDSWLERFSHSIDVWEIEARKRRRQEYDSLVDVVVWPETTEQVAQVVRIAHKHTVPVIPYGAGSGVMGGITPVEGGIAVDLKRMNKIVSIDERSLLVTAQAGMIGGNLEDRLNAKGFTLGHFPQSMYLSTVGGWVGHRAVGTFSTKYGEMDDLLVALEVVLPDGTIARTKLVPKASHGINVAQVFCGAEGILGIVTEVTQQMFPYPEERIYQGVRVPSLADGLEALRVMLQKEIFPAVVRLYDEDESKHRFQRVGLPEGGGLLILVFEGSRELTRLQHRLGMDILVHQFGCDDLGPGPAEQWFARRFDVTSIINWNLGEDQLSFTIEVAGTWSNVYEIYRRMKDALSPLCDVHCHFSHFYRSGASMYFTVYGTGAPFGGIEGFYNTMVETALEACLAAGGSISHHHGIGLAYTPWMEREHGNALEVMRGIKRGLDPAGIMNPGKLVGRR